MNESIQILKDIQCEIAHRIEEMQRHQLENKETQQFGAVAGYHSIETGLILANTIVARKLTETITAQKKASKTTRNETRDFFYNHTKLPKTDQEKLSSCCLKCYTHDEGYGYVLYMPEKEDLENIIEYLREEEGMSKKFTDLIRKCVIKGYNFVFLDSDV